MKKIIKIKKEINMLNNNTISNATSNATGLIAYKPPKMWKDLNVDEKLERIREQVKHNQSQLGYALGRVQQLEIELKNHDHLNGKVLKDIKTLSEGFGGTKALNNPEAEAKGWVYF